MIVTHGEYELDDDPARVDPSAAWRFLSTDAYWARWRRRDDVEAQITGAWRVVGAYRPDGAMVGFARAVSDGVALAYLADVYILPEARGNGLGTELIRTMIDRGPGAAFRWMLHTNDAHTLYTRFGFTPPGPQYLERPARPFPQPFDNEQTRRLQAAEWLAARGARGDFDEAADAHARAKDARRRS